MSNPCTRYHDQLAAQPMGQLSALDLSALEQHLQSCQVCSALREGLHLDDQRLDDFVTHHHTQMEDLENRIVGQLPLNAAADEAQEDFPRASFLGRPWVRVTLAATIAICVFLGVNILQEDSLGSVVWADVIAQVENAQDYICRRLEKKVGEPVQEIVEYRSERFGLRQDIYVQGRLQAEQFIVPAEKTLYALIHRDRTYLKQRLNDEQLEALRERGNARTIVEGFKEYDYKKLGRKKINGRLAEGIEVRNPQEWRTLFDEGVWRLWVDLETQWPVLIEMEGTTRGGKVRKTYTLKDFQWNATLTAQDFAVTIPSDYTLIADLAANKADEEHAVAGLRAYARLLGGRYPSVLNLSTAIAEAEKELDRRHSGYNKAAGKDLQALFLIRDACEFYNALQNDGHDPYYHGDSVEGSDFDKVLMKWRLENGDYRVVYGDLRLDTLTATQLKSQPGED